MSCRDTPRCAPLAGRGHAPSFRPHSRGVQVTGPRSGRRRARGPPRRRTSGAAPRAVSGLRPPGDLVRRPSGQCAATFHLRPAGSPGAGGRPARELREAGATGVETLVADLANPADLARVAERASASAVDLLVNNAGINGYGPFTEVDGDLLDRVLTVNVVALTALTRAAVPGMLARGRGAVINVASLLAFAGDLEAVTRLATAELDLRRGSGGRVAARYREAGAEAREAS
ncbi:SDR family NAD(P)-dependent oxidoreductase [Streptomyces nigra]|uniref:SDR family NAD(P)-dependent oxidoreductase n=1 Tax=Streptomyces nigra TaxID=1827580 RepID=UPI00363E6FFE